MIGATNCSDFHTGRLHVDQQWKWMHAWFTDVLTSKKRSAQFKTTQTEELIDKLMVMMQACVTWWSCISLTTTSKQLSDPFS